MDVKTFLTSQKKQAGSRLAMASGTSFVGSLFLIAQAWCLARMVDGVVFREETISQLWPWLAAGMAAVVLRGVAVYVTDALALRATADIKKHLRERILSAILQLGPARIGRDSAGRFVTLWADQVEALHVYYARYLPARMQTAFLPLAILVLVFPIDWISGLILTVTAPLVPFFMIMIGKDTETLNRRQWKKLNFMGGYLLDVLQGLRTVRLFAAGKREAALVRRVSEDYRLETMKVLSVTFLSSLALEFLATVSIALVAVTVGFRLMWGDMDFLRGFLVLLLAPEFFLPLRRMGVFYHARMDATAAAEGIAAFLHDAEGTATPERVVMPPNIAPEIVFEDVCFSYNSDQPVLDRVSFRIPAGHHAALVGPSGAGKTTILSLLLGFIAPQSGRILVNGVDLSAIDLAAWRRMTGWVPQNPHLFDMSIMDNIALSSAAGASVDSIAGIAVKMHVQEIADGVPDGYDGMVGENGARLSGGQVQRIALARGFFRPSALFLMDEPTARLDIRTEAAISDAIGLAAEKATMIVCAHRLQTVRKMDMVILLDGGRVVDTGTHEALAGRHAFYRMAAG